MLIQQDAFVVTVVQEPARETTVADVIWGALGLTGVLWLIALVVGVLVALALVGWRKRHPPESDRLPPVSPFIPDPNAPPSSQAR